MPTVAEQATLTALELAQAGRFAEIRDRFVPQLRELVVAGRGAARRIGLAGS